MEMPYICGMIERQAQKEIIKKKLSNNPAVVILGARQIGKTTIAKELASLVKKEVKYFDLESINTLNAIKNDPETFLKAYESQLVVLDEVQVYPQLFGVLRSIIDQNRQNGRFLLLGSANPQLVKGVSESLAGRVSYYNLPLLMLTEVGLEYQNLHWLRGGYPTAFLAEDDETFTEWVIDYIKSYVERDVNLIFGLNLSPILIRRLWMLLASLNGSILNTADLSRSLGVSATTINSYLEILEAAFLIHRLNPWYVNIGKRLVKSPKVYIADTGLLHGLLGIASFDALIIHPIVGGSWEGYAIEQIRSLVNNKLDIYFYRTHNGSEVDLVLVKGIHPIACLKIKSSNNPTVSKGFYSAAQDLGTNHNFVIIKQDSYVTIKNISVVSLYDFLNNHLPDLINLS